MKTNNFYNLIKCAVIAAYVSVSDPNSGINNDYPVYDWSGTQLPIYGNKSVHTAMRNLLVFKDESANVYDASTRFSVPNGDNGTTTTNWQKKAFVFGSGSRQESALDYCLEQRLSKNSIRTTCVNTIKEHGVTESLITITNITQNSISIREIGFAVAGRTSVWGESDFVTYNTAVLLERRVLSSPITVEPSESISLVIKTGLEEDLEATVVNP